MFFYGSLCKIMWWQCRISKVVSGSVFQAVGPATEKARRPNIVHKTLPKYFCDFENKILSYIEFSSGDLILSDQVYVRVCV